MVSTTKSINNIVMGVAEDFPRESVCRGRIIGVSHKMSASPANSLPKEAKAVRRASPSVGAPPLKHETRPADSIGERRREAARRALAEARQRDADRRNAEPRLAEAGKRERFGRGGLDPVRYGDWEVKGIATDF